ncbi:hypothetical protein ABW19_dt0203439 [Dactylella cylindrospora]|nr:hypothetical protein ABW19_dt0203439 [Dactylella cylindrospora]
MQNFSRRSYDRTGNTLDPLDEDPVYESKPTQVLRVVNGGIEPRHMRKGSYVEDDTYSVPLASTEEYGTLPTFPNYTSGGVAPDVSGSRARDAKDQLGVPDTRRSSGRNGRSGARRSLILGPQPQPQLLSQTYGNYQPAPKPRFPNPSSSVDYYRQQQQQQSYSRQSRQSGQGLASPGLGRYSPPLEADEDAEDENMRSRSIMIGFEQPSPSGNASQWSTPPSGSNENSASSSSNSIPTIQSFPFPPPQPPTVTPTRRGSSSSNNSVQGKRAHPVSSYYSQASYAVSPIPEESSEYGRHGSFASSHAIPSSWGSGIPGLWIPNSNEELMSDGSSSISKGSGKSRGNDYEDYDEGTTLVRQASMGRKTKPKLTNIHGPIDRSDTSKSKSSRSETSSTSQSQGKRNSIVSLKLDSKISAKEKAVAQPIGSPMEVVDDLTPPPRIGFWQRLSQLSLRSNTPDMSPKPLRIPNGSSPDLRNKEGQTPSSAGGLGSNLTVPQATLNRPRPPRLNIDAVREAEARGSLTSLPDLIRRATKLAAVLETGNRPDSRWGGSRAPSIMSTDTSGHNGQYQESLSDILASFPPPLASGRRLSSRGTAWPLPADMGYMRDADTPSVRRKRKICGLPLWAFIVIVLLGLVVITAAIILPIQLVGLSKNDDNKDALTSETCAASNPCLNGGLASVEDGKCTCVCTNEFFGEHCEESNDPACTSIIVQDTTPGQTVSRNVTFGSAIPRILGVADSKYKVPIDTLTLANTFALQNTTCALQNALVTLNGKTAPSSSSSSSSTGFALDENVIDFGRVAVLYLAETVGMRESVDARENLGTVFANGQDYGVVDVNSSIEIDLTNLKITTSGGQTVVGSARVKALLHKLKRASEEATSRIVRRHRIHGDSW